jgi:hypothetical protein
MHFRVSFVVDGLSDKMCDEPIEYDLAGQFVSHVSIYRQPATMDPPKSGPVLASCTASPELDDSEGLRDLEVGIARSKDGLWANFAGMNEKMRAIYDIVDPIFGQLRAHLKMSVAILKWRYGITQGPINSFSNWSESVSSDGAAWRGISMIRGAKIRFLFPPRKVDAAAPRETGRLHNEGAEPPLALQLLIEALNQRAAHPRSALVIAVTAAEIALKQLIGELAPDAR